jgi:hypothetical protein
MEKNLVEESMRKSKEMGGSARRCHVARKICLKIKGCILGVGEGLVWAPWEPTWPPLNMVVKS